MNKNLTVVILFGGRSSEREVSLRSAADVLKSINREGHKSIPIEIDKEGRWFLRGGVDDYPSPIRAGEVKPADAGHAIAVIPGSKTSPFAILDARERSLQAVDCIISALHGGDGEDGTIGGLLQMLGVPHTGSDTLCSAVCMDKDITRRILESYMIPVVPHTVVLMEDGLPEFAPLAERHGLPLFVKPSNQGSSVGVSVVWNADELRSAVHLAATYSRKILIEPKISGKEIGIAVLGSSCPKISECGEIVSGDIFYTYAEKYSDSSSSGLIIPADVDAETSNSIRKMTEKICSTLNFGVMTRLDFFLSGRQILLNEINTIPGFFENSVYSRLWKSSGLSYTGMINEIIRLTIGRRVTASQ